MCEVVCGEKKKVKYFNSFLPGRQASVFLSHVLWHIMDLMTSQHNLHNEIIRKIERQAGKVIITSLYFLGILSYVEGTRHLADKLSSHSFFLKNCVYGTCTENAIDSAVVVF